tara:strand:- start:2222 stop:2674 length:453 start_codon:yes stop_codon:yes gene_type:complete
MKHYIKEAVRWQAEQLESEYSTKVLITDLEDELKLPPEEREYADSDSEIQEQLNEAKEDAAKHKSNHERAISLDRCILPQMAVIRIKSEKKDYYRKSFTSVDEYDINRHFFLLGEVMQAPGHINVISSCSGRILPMVHTGDFELVPPQEF